MIGGSHPPAAQSLTAFLFRFFGSTGVKMFLILTLALLPLGLIALVASLQAIETADLEKEALLRVAVSQSARKLTADLESDRTALQLTVNNLAATPSDTSICDRLNLFLAKNDRDGGRYAIYDRAGRTLCASHPDLAPIVPSQERFGGPTAQLLDGAPYLLTRVRSRDDRLVGLIYYSRAHLESAADPATALQNRRLSLHEGHRRLNLSPARPFPAGAVGLTSLSAPLEPPNIVLTMTVRDPPETLARTLSLFLPLVMWFAAAAIGWFVVNRLLIRPLVLLRRTVAAYHPGEVLEPMRRVRTPAREIIALGETFREISEDVATHEAEMAEGLETQRKLTREVHHRVKNNLQLISSIMSMQMRRTPDATTREILSRLQDRVLGLATIHRTLYESQDVGRVNAARLLREIVAQQGAASGAGPELATRLDLEDLELLPDQAVPLSLLTSEALANALPAKLGRDVADLGAGWGYLSSRILQIEGIETVHLVEAEHDALACARRNINDARAQFLVNTRYPSHNRWANPL